MRRRGRHKTSGGFSGLFPGANRPAPADAVGVPTITFTSIPTRLPSPATTSTAGRSAPWLGPLTRGTPTPPTSPTSPTSPTGAHHVDPRIPQGTAREGLPPRSCQVRSERLTAPDSTSSRITARGAQYEQRGRPPRTLPDLSARPAVIPARPQGISTLSGSGGDLRVPARTDRPATGDAVPTNLEDDRS
jgi:hypothetical protein